MARKSLDVSCYRHASEFVAATWTQRRRQEPRIDSGNPQRRASCPDPRAARQARNQRAPARPLRKSLNQNEHALKPDEAERRALAWLERASLPVSALNDGDLVGDLLDTLAQAPRRHHRPRRTTSPGGGA